MNTFKLIKIKLLVIFALILTNFSAEISLANTQLSQTNAVHTNDEQRKYSEALSLILEIASKHFDTEQISIAGGTARSLIQNVLTGSPFVFRDFDIVFSANQNVSAESARAFGLDLEKNGLGKFSFENLRSRPRFNPEIQDLESAKKYNAGFGFFVMSLDNTEYDISIYHSDFDLALNGIMDVDRFQVVIKKNITLLNLMENPQLFKSSLIDPENALSKIINKHQLPNIVKWGELAKDPAMIAIRIVRTLAKFSDLPLDQMTQKRIKKMIQDDFKGNPLQIARNFLKLLEDPNWLFEYKQLVDIGLFTHQFKSFKKALSDSSVLLKAVTLPEKILTILKKSNPEDALLYLKILAPLEPNLIREILPLYIRQNKLKVGFFSGEFAPFHRGHEGVVRSALQSKAVDLIFVLPTPFATNNPKTNIFNSAEWIERTEFAKAGLEDISQAWVWPMSSVDLNNVRRLDGSIQSLESFLNYDQLLTHISGMDSFHRVVYRELLEKDSRPRVVVTRIGVPIPDEISDPSVRVIENVYSRPVSASRLLHEIAVQGTTVDLAPKVLARVKATPRYQKIMSSYLNLKTQFENNMIQFKSYKNKTLVWKILENHAGLMETSFPTFSETHFHILKNLLSLEPKKIIVDMIDEYGGQTLVQRQWIRKLREFSNVIIETEKLPVDYTKYTEVVHSGTMNEKLKKSVRKLTTGSQNVIIYETEDQPLSPLLLSIEGLKIIKPLKIILSCKSLFKAS